MSAQVLGLYSATPGETPHAAMRMPDGGIRSAPITTENVAGIRTFAAELFAEGGSHAPDVGMQVDIPLPGIDPTTKRTWELYIALKRAQHPKRVYGAINFREAPLTDCILYVYEGRRIGISRWPGITTITQDLIGSYSGINIQHSTVLARKGLHLKPYTTIQLSMSAKTFVNSFGSQKTPYDWGAGKDIDQTMDLGLMAMDLAQRMIIAGGMTYMDDLWMSNGCDLGCGDRTPLQTTGLRKLRPRTQWEPKGPHFTLGTGKSFFNYEYKVDLPVFAIHYQYDGIKLFHQMPINRSVSDEYIVPPLFGSIWKNVSETI